MSEPETGTPPRLPKPESLEAKFKLAIGLPYDPRAKRKHMLVHGFILDWYHGTYGDALASVRHVVDQIKERDPHKKGLSVPHVHSALTELVEWGYLTQDKGAGNRASRYIPIWDLVCKNPSVTPVGNATDFDPSVTPGVNATVTPVGNTTSASVTNGGSEDPLTGPGHKTGEQERGNECATPTAPPAPPAPPANAADAAVTAQDEFEQLWRAYDYRKNKREARAAFRKMAPDTQLFATILAAAFAWRESWTAQGKSKAPRFRLDKWLEREEYDCDPPTGYQSKERKAKAPKTVPAKVADNDNEDDLDAPGEWIGDVGVFSPFGRFGAEIVGSKVHWLDEYNEQVVLTLRLNPSGGIASGVEVEHTFLSQSAEEKKQTRGQAFLRRIAVCLGIEHDLEDTDVFHGRILSCFISNRGEISYMPVMQVLKEAA